MTTTITIDGTPFSIPLIKVGRQPQILDKENTGRTADGTLHREIIGLFPKYSMATEDSDYDQSEYEAFYAKLIELVESHAVIMPDGESFNAYFSSVSDELIEVRGGVPFYGNLTFSIIATSAVATP